MPDAPRVTIGMPLFQAERYLERTLDTILAQTFRDFELIISDNASTDATDEICRRYAASDPRIRYVRNARNMGATYNYNRLIHLARGTYFKHAAYDDLLAPTCIERLVDVLERDPGVVLAYPGCVVIDGDGRPARDVPRLTDLVSREPHPHERLRRYIPRGGAEGMCNPVFGLFRTAALKRTRLLGAYVSADSILLGEILLYGHVECVDEPLFFERFHAGGSVLSNPGIDARYAWFDPAITPRASNRLFHWRWLLELIRAIDHAPLAPTEKARCYLVLRDFLVRYQRLLALNLLWAGWFSLRHVVRSLRTGDLRSVAAAFC